MAAHAQNGSQVAEVTLAQFRGELELLASERAAARARRHRDRLSVVPEDFPALARDLLATTRLSVELAGKAASESGPRDLARQVGRISDLHRYLSVEGSAWVARARRDALTAELGLDELLELCRQRDQLAKERGAASWLELLFAVIGVSAEELERIDIEMRRELERSPFADAVADSDVLGAGDPEHQEETSWIPPREVGEFLGRLGLGSFWDGLVCEAAPAFTGAEALPVGGAGHVRIFVGEAEGHIPARMFLGAVGAALHDHCRTSAPHGWCLPETSVLRGGAARFFARYHDRAGWQVAYCHLDYDLALELEARSGVIASRKLWWRHAIARWEASLHISPPETTDDATARLRSFLGITDDRGTDDPEMNAYVRAAIVGMLERPAICTWIETVIAENLFGDLAAPPDATIDNPAVGKMLPDLLGRPDHEPWEARMEVLRAQPLSGKLRPWLPGRHSA